MSLELPRTNNHVLRELSDIDVELFDCGDEKLNSYFKKDARENEDELISKNYFLTAKTDKLPLVGISISNAGITANNDLDMVMLSSCIYRTYPAVRIGRLATHKDHRRKDLGATMIFLMQTWFTHANKTGCRFLIVDSRKEIIEFYKKNRFVELPGTKKDSDTELLYCDLMPFKNLPQTL